MKRLIFISGFILFATVRVSAQGDWRILELESVRVGYHAADWKIAELTLDAVANNFNRIAEFVGYEGPMTSNIIITGSEEEFVQHTGGTLPEWGEASTDYSRNLIVIKSPSFSGSTLEEFELTVVHELTHYLIGSLTATMPIPRWLNEGTAVFLTRNEDFMTKLRISRALFTGSLIPLGKIGEVLTFGRQKANLAYAQSRLGVEFLVAESGDDAVQILVNLTQEKDSFEQALEEVTGMDMYEFEVAYRDYLKERYRVYFLAAAYDYIWILLPGLFILAYIMVRLRNRLTIRKWEIEETEGGDVPEDYN